jgi:hypothetical protein
VEKNKRMQGLVYDVASSSETLCWQDIQVMQPETQAGSGFQKYRIFPG